MYLESKEMNIEINDARQHPLSVRSLWRSHFFTSKTRSLKIVAARA